MKVLSRNSAAIAACVFISVADAAVGDIEEVVVTATRVEQPVSQVIGSVTVITRAEIERRQLQSLQDLLRGEAGIEIANLGGPGKLSSVFLRGANANQTLFLVDGVRLGSATAGTTSIEFIPVEQIERIEIVRGPRSSLYGSDAIGGVIQIFTRRAEGISASAGAGSHKTQEYSSSFGMSGEALRFSVSGGYLQSDGFNACKGSFSSACYTIEPDSDGYRSTSGSARLGYAFGKVADLELSTLYAQGYTEYDGYYDHTRFRESAPVAKLIVHAGDALQLTALGGITQEKTQLLGVGTMGRFNTEKRNASVQADWQAGEAHTVTLGADYLRDLVDSDTDYERNSRRNAGVFAQYQGQFGAHELLGALRRDDNEQFGQHTTGNAGWKWFVIDRAFALNAGWGSAFHAPTFNDLYYPFGSGNPNLKPERSRSYEFGASGEAGWLTWSAQLFNTQAKDLIALDSNYVPANVSEARLRGAELMLRGRWDRFSAALNYTALDPRSRDPGNYNHLLARRARQSGRLDLGYDLGVVALSSAVNIAGARYDDLANTVRLGGYATVDVAVTLKLGKAWSLQAKMANALDRDYETARYYNQDGRNFFVTVRYQPTRRD